MKLLYQQSEPIILASSSPRRRELLSELGISFEVVPANIDESLLPAEQPPQLAARLARQKAEFVAKQMPNRLVLGADTDVAINGQILGKPADQQDACRILGEIAGRTHTVWGGCALVCISRGINEVIVSSTLVTLRPISRELIERYTATGEPLDKAGAYAVQGIGSQFIERIEGSYPNVVGLDTPRVVELLRQFNVLK